MPSSHLTFSSLYLPPPILAALTSLSYLHPSPIQLHCIPPALHGLDLIAQAHSGTGKSLVFAILSLIHALRRPSPPRVGLSSLVLVPTRELGVQVEGVIRVLAAQLGGVKVESVMGGKGGVREDRERLQDCDVLIATVGRLRHLVDDGLLRAEQLSLLTLDEADALLSPTSSFAADVSAILAALPPYPRRQTLLFSATWPMAVMARAKEVTADAQLVLLDSQQPHQTIQHFVLYVHPTLSPSVPDPEEAVDGAGSAALPPMLSAGSSTLDAVFDAKFASLLALLSSFPFHQCLVFSRSPSHVALLTHSLTLHGYPTRHLSAGLEASERTATLESFRALQTRVLVASDVLARGFDHPTVNLVVHWDDAYNAEAFLHRGGRTGRWGRRGRTVWLVERGGEERVQRMERLAGLQLLPLQVVDGRVVGHGHDGGYEAEVRKQRRRMTQDAHDKWALEKFDAARKEALEEMDDTDRGRDVGEAEAAAEEEVGDNGEEERRDESRMQCSTAMPGQWGVISPLVIPFSPFEAAPLFPALMASYPQDVLQLNAHARTAAAQFHSLQQQQAVDHRHAVH